MLFKINKLKSYNVMSEKNKKFKKGVIKNLNILYKARIDIIKGFKNGTFSMTPNIENISEQTDTAKEQKTNAYDSESDDEKPKIPEWVYINDFSFNTLKNKIENAVNKNLGPMLGEKKLIIYTYKIFYKGCLMGNIMMQRKQENITLAIFVKSMKNI